MIIDGDEEKEVIIDGDEEEEVIIDGDSFEGLSSVVFSRLGS